MYAFRTALRPIGLFLPEFVHVAARFVCDIGLSYLNFQRF